MKKILSVATVFALLVVGAVSAKAAVDLGNGYSLNGTGNISFYGATLTPGADGEENSTINEESYRFELYLNKAFDNGGRAVLRLRSGDREGSASGFGFFRPTINDQNFGGVAAPTDNGIIIRELYYQQPLFEKLVYFKVGKMQPATSGNNGGNSVGSFFTDDATVQNVDGVLGSYGVEFGMSPIDILTISYSFLGQSAGNTNDKSEGLFSHGYHTVLLTAQPIEKGNYRLGFWYSDIKRSAIVKAGESAEEPTGSNGVFFSADQVVADNFQLFARFGIRLDKTVGTGAHYDPTDENKDYKPGQAGMDWQIGTTIFGALWGRAADSFFIGIGQASAQSDYCAEILNDFDSPSAEMHIEANYSFSLAPGISLTPFFQYVSNIYSYHKNKSDIVYDSGMAYGIRTQIKF
jgi:hypothetical protein